MKNKLFLFCALILFSCRKNLKEFKEIRFLMDTICEIKIFCYDSNLAKKAVDEVFKEVEKIDKKFGYSKESEIEKINSKSGVSFCEVSYEVLNLVKESITLSKLTDGAFDITVGVLSHLWGFKNFSNEKKFKIPQKHQIVEALSLVGYEKIVIDEEKNRIFLKKRGMKIDLGGIAKGYAIKKAKEILESYGFDKFLINFGGDIYLKNNTEIPWRVAIQHPRDRNKFLAVLNLYTTSCVTSGDYERYFMLENKRYHHIFDPKTGYPADDIVSVTVLCEDPVLADALSTGIFVLGEKKGIQLAEKLKIGCIIVKEKKNKLFIYTTQNFKGIDFNL
ncbi:MAG: FAD:protein FMN transferase [Endomicrobiia bacterium]